MGYCIDGDDQFDIFLSYAHADDILNIGFVTGFERYLKEMVPAALTGRPEADRGRLELFRVCRYKTGFPRTGQLDQVIEDYVGRSRFLFIFLGSGYLASEWCFAELEKFRENNGGDLHEALKRLYVIVLERDALLALREGRKPPDLSPERKRFWTELQGIAKGAIRIENFLKDGELVPVYRDGSQFDPAFHEAGKVVVKDLVTKLIDCRTAASPAAIPPPRDECGKIVIGAVPVSLAALRDELVASLGGNVQFIKEADLRDPAKIMEQMRGGRLFVQPFDRSPPIGGGIFSPGGHLAFQQTLFEDALSSGHLAQDASFIWWEPPLKGAPNALSMGDEDAVFLRRLDSLPPDQKRTCSPKALAHELLGPGGGPWVWARVWVEWEDWNTRAIDEAKRKVQERFDAYRRQRAAEGIELDATLKFGMADWETLEKFGLKDPKRPDGVILVYNEHKDLGALIEQSDHICALEDVVQKKMFPGIFYMKDEGMLVPTEDWGFVRFVRRDKGLTYLPEELDDFVVKLFELLHRKYFCGTSAGRAG